MSRNAIRARVLAALSVLFVLVSVLAPGSPARATTSSSPSHDGLTTYCLVTRAAPAHERTIHVPRGVGEILLRLTLSYRGACADYGQSKAQGDGTLTAYSQSERGRPTAVGLVMSRDALQGLPHDPPTDGTWCYDKDGDGTTDPMTECSNGYESQLALSDQGQAETPFTYLLVNWNPMGHPPGGVYDKPHFDVHFYMDDPAERLKIRPGPCGELVNCDDFELGKKLPEARYYPSDFEFTGAVAPGMGTHLIDLTGPEFHGQPFTHTWIYGTWNGDVTFYEPMVTKDWFDGLVDRSREDQCFPIKQPQAFQKEGDYPTRYCLRYRDNRQEVTASLEGFVHHQAS